MYIHEDEKLLKISEKAFEDWRVYMDEQWDKISNSDLFFGDNEKKTG